MKHLEDILAIFNINQISVESDFHSLTWDQVTKILLCARIAQYRCPANAPGSRARMFFEAVKRAEAKESAIQKSQGRIA